MNFWGYLLTFVHLFLSISFIIGLWIDISFNIKRHKMLKEKVDETKDTKTRKKLMSLILDECKKNDE